MLSSLVLVFTFCPKFFALAIGHGAQGRGLVNKTIFIHSVIHFFGIQKKWMNEYSTPTVLTERRSCAKKTFDSNDCLVPTFLPRDATQSAVLPRHVCPSVRVCDVEPDWGSVKWSYSLGYFQINYNVVTPNEVNITFPNIFQRQFARWHRRSCVARNLHSSWRGHS